MAAKKKSPKASIPIAFIESMECLPVSALPEGKEWSYEIKLDGFRLEAVKKNGETTFFSLRRVDDSLPGTRIVFPGEPAHWAATKPPAKLTLF
jgi:ATP-dependent DNA ligase